MDEHNIQQRITGWLVSLGFKVGNGPTDERLAWVLIAEVEKEGWGVSVVRYSARPDCLFVQGSYPLDQRHVDQYDSLLSDAQCQVLWEIQHGLIMVDVEFEKVEHPLRRVHLMTVVFDEELTRPRLWVAISTVGRGLAFLSSYLKWQFGEPLPNKIH